MHNYVNVSDTQLLAVLQETDPQFEPTIGLLKRHGNTIVNTKRFTSWVDTCRKVLFNAGDVEINDECEERLIRIISKQAGFHIHVRKSDHVQPHSRHFWNINDVNNILVFEKGN